MVFIAWRNAVSSEFAAPLHCPLARRRSRRKANYFQKSSTRVSRRTARGMPDGGASPRSPPERREQTHGGTDLQNSWKRRRARNVTPGLTRIRTPLRLKSPVGG